MLRDNRKVVSLKLILTATISIMIVILVGVVTFIAATMGFSTVKETYSAQLKGSSVEIARQMEHFYQQQETNALFFAQNEIIVEAAKTGNYGTATRMMELFFNKQGIYENLFISSPELDTVSVADGIGGKSVGIHWGAGLYETNVKKNLNKELWVSNPIKSPTSGRPVVLISAPIIAGNSVVGILGLAIDIGTFSANLVNDMKIGITGYPYITTSEGLCFAHPNADLIMKLNISEYDWGKEILSKPDGSIIRYTFDGIDKFISFAKSDKYGIVACSTIAVSDIKSYVSAMARNLIIAGVLCALLTVAVVVIMMNVRLNPLKSAVSMLSDIAQGEGDLTKRLQVKGNDEISELGRWFNEFIGQIENMVAGIKKLAIYVESATQEVAAGTQGVSQATQEQASAIEELAATIEEIASSIKLNAANATDGRLKVVEAVHIADTSGKTAQELVGGMEEISNASKKIGDIISTVNEVAFQTNLLALNAAVEAARAGEHGKGFAVVADEVRALAQKSAEASKQIKSLIEDAVNKVHAGDLMVKKSHESLEETISYIQSVSQIMEEIETASSEQASGVDELNRAITQIDTSTQQNATTVEELASTSDSLRAEARQLARGVEKFKVSDSGETHKDYAHKKNGTKHSAAKSAPGKKEPMQKSAPPSTESDFFEEF